ncbi:DUF423 domain-containing protein [Glacieibacterium sp.]|uniref:DUF423 domain-containing protein n=1 Tax=Glacieibacterium sp. TaxID=2860237 RepID=UPI003AFFD88E
MLGPTPISNTRWLPALAALNGALAIAFGAFAAHGIHDPQAREWIRTAVEFQLPHAVAVFALLGWRNSKRVRGAGWALGLGSLCFALSLDGLALGLPRAVAALAPVGGALMICGWLAVGVLAIRTK